MNHFFEPLLKYRRTIITPRWIAVKLAVFYRILYDLAQSSCVQIFFVQKSDRAGLQSQPMKLPVGVGADQDNARGGRQCLDAPRTANTVFIAQHYIDEH